jgi:histidine triad (HIT) family protein
MVCVFCDAGPNAKDVVLADLPATTVVFSDPRLVPGHLLIIPKRHVISLVDLTTAERAEAFDTAIEFQQRIILRIAPGCDIRQHDRPFLGQSILKIDHVHLHLLPRWQNDELYLNCQKHEVNLFTHPSQDEVTSCFEKLMTPL